MLRLTANPRQVRACGGHHDLVNLIKLTRTDLPSFVLVHQVLTLWQSNVAVDVIMNCLEGLLWLLAILGAALTSMSNYRSAVAPLPQT